MFKKTKWFSFLAMFTLITMVCGLVPAYAEGETAYPTGGSLFAPPENVISSVAYGLKNADGETVSGTTSISLSENVPNGVYKNGASLILDGSDVLAGAADLKVSTAGASAEVSMSVSEIRYFEDFEDVETGALANTAKLEKLDGTSSTESLVSASSATTVLADSTGNKYAGDAANAFTIELGQKFAGNSYVTISAKVKRATSVGTAQLFNIGGDTGAVAWLGVRGANGNLTSYYKENGEYSSNYDEFSGFRENVWEKIRIVLNFVDHKFDVYINDNLIIGNRTMAGGDANTCTMLTGMTINYMVDDIAIYSGKDFSFTNSISGSENIAMGPSFDTRYTTDKYKVTDSENQEVTDAKLSLAKDYDFAMMIDNALVYERGTKVEDIALIAKDSADNFLAKKTVAVSDTVLFEDFEDAASESLANTAKLEKADGTSSTESLLPASATTPIATESTGNKHTDFGAFTIDLTQKLTGNPYVTISAKVKRNSGTNQLFHISGDAGTIAWLGVAGADGMLTSYYTQEGKYYNSTKLSGGFSTDKWSELRVVLNFADHKYDVYINDSIMCDGWPMALIADKDPNTCTKINSITINYIVDDIAIYSGEQYVEPYSIIGDDNIYLEASDAATNVTGQYKVVDRDNNEVKGAELSLAKATDIAVIRNDAIIAKRGTVTEVEPIQLVAKDSEGNFLAKKDVTVSDVLLYEDFEDGVAAEGSETVLATSTKLEKIDGTKTESSLFTSATETTIVSDSAGNKYADAYTKPLTIDLADSLNGNRYATVSAKIKRVDNQGTNTLIQVNGDKGQLVWLGLTSRFGYLRSFYTADKQYTSTEETLGGTYRPLSIGTWVEVRIVLDFVNKTYDVYLHRDLVCDDWKMITDTNSYLASVSFGYDVDEIKVCTGNKYSIIPDSDVRLNIPAEGESEETVTAKYSDGIAVENLTVSTTATGVTASDNKLKATNAATLENTKIVLTDGFVTSEVRIPAEKYYVLVDDAVYGGGALTDSTAKVKAVFGASDLTGTNRLFIAHYTGEKGEKLVNVALTDASTAKELSRELISDFAAGDIVKVFVWQEGSLVPVKDFDVIG